MDAPRPLEGVPGGANLKSFADVQWSRISKSRRYPGGLGSLLESNWLVLKLKLMRALARRTRVHST